MLFQVVEKWPNLRVPFTNFSRRKSVPQVLTSSLHKFVIRSYGPGLFLDATAVAITAQYRNIFEWPLKLILKITKVSWLFQPGFLTLENWSGQFLISGFL